MVCHQILLWALCYWLTISPHCFSSHDLTSTWCAGLWLSWLKAFMEVLFLWLNPRALFLLIFDSDLKLHWLLVLILCFEIQLFCNGLKLLCPDWSFFAHQTVCWLFEGRHLLFLHCEIPFQMTSVDLSGETSIIDKKKSKW